MAKHARKPEVVEEQRHVKVFLVKAANLDHHDNLHESNANAVVQEAIQQGLHPRGPVLFDGCDDDLDGVTKRLTYSVAVVPARTDRHAASTVTPSKLGS